MEKNVKSKKAKLKKIKNTAQFLLDSGLLFEINRQILHPFGLALPVEIDDDGKAAFGEIIDFRSDPEGFVYDEEAFEVGKIKYSQFLAEFGNERLETRRELLGYIIQEEAND